MTEDNENNQAFEHFKNIFKYLFKKQYKDSLTSLLAFIKALCMALKEFYINHLKGQYVEIHGKRIPRTVIAILCIVFLYLISPMSCIFAPNHSAEETEDLSKVVVYDKDNIKISNMHKCDQAACGDLEYDGEDELEAVRVIVSFFEQNGDKINDSYVDAPQLTPNTHVEFSVPADKKFGYFKLTDVIINPEEDMEEEED